MPRLSTKDPLRRFATREARRQFKRESSVERKHDNGEVHPRAESTAETYCRRSPRASSRPREFVLPWRSDGKSCL